MTDIVERLRDPYERVAWGTSLFTNAADEIESLRAHLAAAQDKFNRCLGDLLATRSKLADAQCLLLEAVAGFDHYDIDAEVARRIAAYLSPEEA